MSSHACGLHNYLIFSRKIKRRHENETEQEKDGANNRNVNTKFGEFVLNGLTLRTSFTQKKNMK